MSGCGNEMSNSAASSSSAVAITTPSVGDPTTVIDEEMLIEEVKKYPSLYTTAYAEYIEKETKNTNWNKVCKSLFKHWKEFSTEKKRETLKMTQLKWKTKTEKFFRRHTYPRSSKKTPIESMKFLINVGDVDVAASVAGPPVPFNQIEPLPSTSQGEDTPFLIPPTSERILLPMEFAPMTHNSPNEQFAKMLVPLLDQLSQQELYIVWPKILDVIKEAEGQRRLGVLKPEMLFSTPTPTPTTVEKTVETEDQTQQEAVEEPTYPSHYGRPTNSEGEIMYPETDPEDLDEI